ncbi:MAG: hypothetical protein FWE53_05235 [Firmicutes bacterium]|nr:hypothetical protein [Bacillota bacterium]
MPYENKIDDVTNKITRTAGGRSSVKVKDGANPKILGKEIELEIKERTTKKPGSEVAAYVANVSKTAKLEAAAKRESERNDTISTFMDGMPHSR